MFKEIADIKTADMLDLPVPKAVFHNISVKPSEIQRDMVAGLAERAERVRNGMVDARVDNMLKITNDGRKLALDQRLINTERQNWKSRRSVWAVSLLLLPAWLFAEVQGRTTESRTSPLPFQRRSDEDR